MLSCRAVPPKKRGEMGGGGEKAIDLCSKYNVHADVYAIKCCHELQISLLRVLKFLGG